MLESGMTGAYASRFHSLLEVETCQLLTDLSSGQDRQKYIQADPNLVNILESSGDSNDVAVSQTLLNFFQILTSLSEILLPYKKAAAKVRQSTVPWVCYGPYTNCFRLISWPTHWSIKRSNSSTG